MSNDSTLEMKADTPLIWGNLKDFHFPDILAYLYSTRKTGILYIARERVKKHIYIREGVPTAARSNLKSELMGEFLVSKGLINAHQQQQALGLQKHSTASFGAILLEHEMITKKDLFIQARRQFLSILFSLFGLAEGFYKFKEEELPPNFYYFKVTFSNLLIFGIRQISDARVIKEMVGDLNQIPVPTKRFPEYKKIMFTAKELTVINDIDGTRTSREIMNETRVDPLVCLKTLLILLHHDFIKFRINFNDQEIEKVIDLEASAAASLGFDSYQPENTEEETAVAGDDFLIAPETAYAPHSFSSSDEAPSDTVSVPGPAPVPSNPQGNPLPSAPELLELDSGQVEAAFPDEYDNPEGRDVLHPAPAGHATGSLDENVGSYEDATLPFGSLMDEAQEKKTGPFARAYKSQKQDTQRRETKADPENDREQVPENPGAAVPGDAPDESERIPWTPENEAPRTEAEVYWEGAPSAVEGPEPQEALSETDSEAPAQETEKTETTDPPPSEDLSSSPLPSDKGAEAPSENEASELSGLVNSPDECSEPELQIKGIRKGRVSPAYVTVLAVVVAFGIFSLSPWKAELQDRLFSRLNGKEPSTLTQLAAARPETQAPSMPTEAEEEILPVPHSPEQRIKAGPETFVPDQAAPARGTDIEEAVPSRTEEAQTTGNMKTQPPEQGAEAQGTPDTATDSGGKELSTTPARPESIPETAPVTPSDPWQAKMTAWTERLRNTPASKYTIQVEISENLKLIRNDLDRLNGKYDAMLVGFKVRDWSAYTLLVGTFDSRQEGNKALKDLPKYVQKQRPLVKTMATIQKGLVPVK